MAVETWRFVNSRARAGDLNMAIDRLLAEQSRPALRLYAWNPPAISLGFHQSLADVNLELCSKDGIDVVQRPTGGRAVLHAEELTYAVVLPRSSSFYHHSVLSVYEAISKAIIRSLRHLDLPIEWEPAQKSPQHLSKSGLSSVCYASTAQYEIGYQGKKLVGSAQRRIGEGVLQHGSVLIGEKHLDLPFYLKRGDPRTKQSIQDYMRKHTICLNQISDPPLSFDSLMAAFKFGFAQELDIEWQDQDLSPREWTRAKDNRDMYQPSKGQA